MTTTNKFEAPAMGHHGPEIHGLANEIQRVFPQTSPKGQVEDPKHRHQ